MNDMKVKFLMGPADCNDRNVPGYANDFLEKTGKAMNTKIVCAEMDEVKKQSLPVYFIASGGSENGFRENYQQTREPYILLTVPAYNSLAAAMEIMGFLQENHLRGEIIHGTPENAAKRLAVLKRAAEARETLSRMKLGCIGEPGGLIASDVDAGELEKACGAKMQKIELSELTEEYKKGGYEENIYTRELKEKGYDPAETEKALHVYGALKRLITKYQFDAVTVKCFDLLNAIHTTGCLALAILNAEGIPAACEGDQKSLVSMAVLRALTGVSGFMANPSCLDPETSEIIFAHCTLPIDMPDTYTLTTHFESGIGVAVSGEMKAQTVTVFKCDGSLKRHYAGRADLLETMHRPNLCRSQMRLKLEDGTEYFTAHPISNHHIICKGDWKEVIDEFFNQII